MKKIAFMFVAAAMFVACGENKPVALTAQDSAAVKDAISAEIQKELDAVEIPEAPVAEEGQEIAEEVQQAYDAAVEAYNAKVDSIKGTAEAKLAQALADKLAELQAPAKEAK